MVKTACIAYGVRVKLNENFEERSIAHKHLKDEKVLWIADPKPYNDANGQYVYVRGGSLINSGVVYLNEIDLEFEVPSKPLYTFDDNNTPVNVRTENAPTDQESENKFKLFVDRQAKLFEDMQREHAKKLDELLQEIHQNEK